MDFARQFGEEAAEREVLAPRNEHFKESLCVGGMPTKHAVSLIWERLRAFQQVRGGRDALQLFRSVDENNDGFVKPDEFLNFLEHLNIAEVTRHIAKAAIKAADANRGGKLDYEELLGVVADESSSSSDSDSTKPPRKEPEETGVLEHLKIDAPRVVQSTDAIWSRMRSFAQESGGLKALQLFQTFDRDGDGKITVREFRSALTMVGIQGVPLHEVKALLATVDLDGDGRLSYAEFLTALTESVSDEEVGGSAVRGNSGGDRSRPSTNAPIANRNERRSSKNGYAALNTREEVERPASSPRSMSMGSGETPTFSPPPPSRHSKRTSSSPDAVPPLPSSLPLTSPHSSAHRSKSKAASSPTKAHNVRWLDGVPTGDAAAAAAAAGSSSPGPLASPGSRRSSRDGSQRHHSQVNSRTAGVAATAAGAPRENQLPGRLPPRVLKPRRDAPPSEPDSHDGCESRLLEMHDLSRLLKDGKASDDDLARYWFFFNCKYKLCSPTLFRFGALLHTFKSLLYICLPWFSIRDESQLEITILLSKTVTHMRIM
jgi:Ca2+-binding EF-hand superfamily protein